MTSLDVAGKCQDESCCLANAPERECRCFIADRLRQMERIRARLPEGADDAMVHAVWKERLRCLGLLAEAIKDEEMDSPVFQHTMTVCDEICELTEADSDRETPITREEWKAVAALEGWE